MKKSRKYSDAGENAHIKREKENELGQLKTDQFFWDFCMKTSEGERKAKSIYMDFAIEFSKKNRN